MKVFLLAAGEGRRLRPLTNQIPKPLLVAGGLSLIERWIDRFRSAGYREFVVNTWHGKKALMDALGDGGHLGVSIRYSEEPYLLETGGGIKYALPLLGDEGFIVVSSDIACDFDPRELSSLANDTLAHLVLVDNPSHHPEGDFSLARDGKLGSGTGRLTYAGVGVFSPELFTDVPDGAFKLRLLMDRGIAQRRITGQHYSGFWLDVGTVERYRTLQQHYGDEP